MDIDSERSRAMASEPREKIVLSADARSIVTAHRRTTRLASGLNRAVDLIGAASFISSGAAADAAKA